MLLGAIADDFTGATDLANTLVRGGMRTVQTIGVPAPGTVPGDVDAVVVALKSRTNPVQEAIADSLAALDWIRSQGARQVFFKYCSTFDSTDRGNIGPVADALLEALGAGFTIACPAFPTTGRTIYKGYLFVGDVLLSESSMKDHPLNPMTDPSLVRVLARQTPHKVGLVKHATVARDAAAIRTAFGTMKAAGIRHAVVDAVDDSDLYRIGEACSDMALITGGSGVALGLPENFRRQGLLVGKTAAELPTTEGPAVVLAGSCSARTQEQVAAVRDSWPTYRLDPLEAGSAEAAATAALDWAAAQKTPGPILVYSTADAATIQAIQSKLGREAASTLVEDSFARIARGLVDRGVRRMIVAGGETAGAVVQALGVRALRIGPEIDPGVPWTEAVGEVPLALALKSGNFGAPDFFAKALGMLK